MVHDFSIGRQEVITTIVQIVRVSGIPGDCKQLERIINLVLVVLIVYMNCVIDCIEIQHDISVTSEVSRVILVKENDYHGKNNEAQSMAFIGIKKSIVIGETSSLCTVE